MDFLQCMRFPCMIDNSILKMHQLRVHLDGVLKLIEFVKIFSINTVMKLGFHNPLEHEFYFFIS